MHSGQEMKHIELEIFSMQNPLLINMSNFKNIIGLELERFHYNPIGTAPSVFLGIKASGSRGRFNEFGMQTEIIKTVPLVSGAFDYSDQNGDRDATQYLNTGTDLVITFVERQDQNLNPKLFTFDTNYLLNLTIFVST